MNLPRRLLELWHRLDVTIRDLPLGLLLVVMSFMPVLYGQETQVGNLPGRPFDAVAILALCLQCSGVVIRRKLPIVSVAAVSLGFLIAELGSYHMVASSAIGVAMLGAGAHLAHHRRPTMIALSLTYVALAITLVRLGAPESLAGYVVFYLMLAACWGIGTWLRRTRIAEAERRRLIAEQTRTAERTRIAGELHDVVTHHVTAMVVQVEAARYQTADPERLDQTLATVTDTGRRAITDLRHLLDLLNPEHDTDATTPSIRDLDTLVAQTRASGQPVEFIEDGEPAITSGSADLVANRVVREALTNALKYAHGIPTTVQVRHRDSEINVEVRTDGTAVKEGIVAGSGRGLVGLRERVDAVGGDFSAGPRGNGGFLVSARIPARSTS